MKLTVFQYGKTEITEKMAFQSGSETVKLPIALLFFLIEVPGRRILVDVGCDTMPGFPLYRFEKPVEVLERAGFARESITDVLLTHAHHDHIDGLRYYPQADVWLHRAEAEAARDYLTNTEKLHLFEDSAAICENVKLQYIGGHCAGSGVVLLTLPQKIWVLCGDECYTRENLVRRQPTGSSFSPEKSRAFVEEYSGEAYHTVLFHDPELVGEIGSRVLF